MTAMVELNINGQTVKVGDDPQMPLLWAIRDLAGLPGTKFGCGAGLCGACTVHVDGVATRACITPIGDVTGTKIATIDALSEPGSPSPVQAAWIAEQVPQCGYCQSGMIMAATALLADNPSPTDADIDETMTNICRCGTYGRIRKAIHQAARAMREVANG